MNFKEAFELMKNGAKIKLPSWAGYWCWENDTIMMYCKDGKVLDIRETQTVNYTFSNVACDDWIIADKDNTPVIGGVASFSFGEAIKYLKRGLKVARKGWNGKGIFIELQIPDEHSKMTHPYIFIDTTGLKTSNPDAPKSRVPWLASQTDMLAEDWIFVD